jgi:hypothetical protein
MLIMCNFVSYLAAFNNTLPWRTQPSCLFQNPGEHAKILRQSSTISLIRLFYFAHQLEDLQSNRLFQCAIDYVTYFVGNIDKLKLRTQPVLEFYRTPEPFFWAGQLTKRFAVYKLLHTTELKSGRKAQRYNIYNMPSTRNLIFNCNNEVKERTT